MNGPSEPSTSREVRFPGFDVVGQSHAWDRVTAGVVLARLQPVKDLAFFTVGEGATAIALVDQLLDQHGDRPVPAVAMIDARLALSQTDGWHYEQMPEDGQAWRDTLGYLEADAFDHTGCSFAVCSGEDQAALISGVQNLGSSQWHGLPAGQVWSLWTRYACTAFYSHPLAWNEMGFGGPAYPRGYKNLGVDSLEPFEVRDAHPGEDPVRGDR